MMRILFLMLITMATVLQADVESNEPVDFSLSGIHGGEVRLGQYRGGWVVLNYWATWCVPCRKEIPELSELNEARDDITVLGLTYEDVDTATLDRFLQDFEVKYPLLLVDVYAPPEPFGSPAVLPTSFIIDPQGFVVKTFVGPVSREGIEAFINKLID